LKCETKYSKEKRLSANWGEIINVLTEQKKYINFEHRFIIRFQKLIQLQ